MADKLKLAALADDKPVKIAVVLPAAVHADLAAYGVCLARESGAAEPIDPERLIAPMLAKFLATDRAFAKMRRSMEGSPS
jgi:hypothetical protein